MKNVFLHFLVLRQANQAFQEPQLFAFANTDGKPRKPHLPMPQHIASQRFANIVNNFLSHIIKMFQFNYENYAKNIYLYNVVSMSLYTAF